MNCEQTRDLLSPAVDAELSVELARAVSLHLEDCGDCRAETEVLEELSALVRGVGDAPAPQGLLDRIERAAAQRGLTPVRSWRQRTTWVLPRLAAVLVGALSIELLVGTPTVRQPSGFSLPSAASPLEARSSLHLLAFESQAELELGGSFSRDFRVLARSPEDRLMFDLTGGR